MKCKKTAVLIGRGGGGMLRFLHYVAREECLVVAWTAWVHCISYRRKVSHSI